MELLTTKGASINFGGLWAVDSVDFTLGQGKVIGLIGPNGSGKTTFFNLLSGIYRATRGSIIFNHEDITRLLPYQISRKGISRTYQSSRLCWNLSVIDNILIGLHAQQKTNFFKAVFQPGFAKKEIYAGIEDSLELLSFFNQELVEKRYELVKNIPLIDRRRIEIVRALISKPRLLLLDEPSAGLNNQETMTMMRDIGKIKDKMKDISIIIIEHDMGVMEEVPDSIVVFNAGKKIAEGTFNDIISNEEVRRAYLGGEAS